MAAAEQARLIERAAEVTAADSRIQAARKSDGNKRLNRYLTAGQRAFLEALPPVAARRDAVIEFDRRVAAEFIRRGRALAAATSADWPADLEAATRAYLQRQLGDAWSLDT